MAAPKYEGDHRRTRKAWEQVVAAGNAMCMERVCLMPARWIAPGSQWHLAHNPEGTLTIGPAHAVCNLSEAGKRGNPTGVAKRKRRWWPARDW